jgi:hypothetical protein
MANKKSPFTMFLLRACYFIIIMTHKEQTETDESLWDMLAPDHTLALSFVFRAQMSELHTHP